MITMALSTSIPMAKMKAARETRCIVPSMKPRSRKLPMTMTQSEVPMMMPLLMPIKNIRMTTTITTLSIRFITKVPSESTTRSG